MKQLNSIFYTFKKYISSFNKKRIDITNFSTKLNPSLPDDLIEHSQISWPLGAMDFMSQNNEMSSDEKLTIIKLLTSNIRSISNPNIVFNYMDFMDLIGVDSDELVTRRDSKTILTKLATEKGWIKNTFLDFKGEKVVITDLSELITEISMSEWIYACEGGSYERIKRDRNRRINDTLIAKAKRGEWDPHALN